MRDGVCRIFPSRPPKIIFRITTSLNDKSQEFARPGRQTFSRAPCRGTCRSWPRCSPDFLRRLHTRSCIPSCCRTCPFIEIHRLVPEIERTGSFCPRPVLSPESYSGCLRYLPVVRSRSWKRGGLRWLSYPNI